MGVTWTVAVRAVPPYYPRRMASPFDDPEFHAQMERAGVVHTPGMAEEMLRRVAPLLASEGIDLDNLDMTDLDAVNAALARATERHNLELFTPVGVRRDGALAVLRRFAVALADGDDDLARAILASVEPEPEDDAPAISHVIGVSLGVLDEWHTDSAKRAALAATGIPRWAKRSSAAATDILALARKGRAFDALDGLHRRHSGLAIFEGAALVVAASAAALADHERGSVNDLVGRLLIGDGGGGGGGGRDGAGDLPPRTSGAAFGLGTAPEARRVAKSPPPANPPSAVARITPPSADRPVAREFGQWLRRSAQATAPEAASERRVLEALFAFARTIDLDLHRADGAEELAEALFEMHAELDDPDMPESAIDTLHDYVHFRIDTATDASAWEDAHDAVEEVMAELSSVPDAIAHAIAADAEIDPDTRHAALAATRIVAAVGDLLDWLGSGRQAAPSGGVRRADIQQVAGMLGVSAVGVSKLPPRDSALDDLFDSDAPLPTPETIPALSMMDVPPLAAWWEALIVTGVIETRPSRVRPGPEAAGWSSPLPPLEAADMLVGMFVAEVLMQTRAGTAPAFEEPVMAEAISRLLRALAPDLVEDSAPSGLASLLTPRVLLRLRSLEIAGLLQTDATGALIVPDALRGAVARGVMVALSMLTADAGE